MKKLKNNFKIWAPSKVDVLVSVLLFSLFTSNISAQSQVFKSDSKYGIKQGDKIIIAPIYDTIFNFDIKNKVCLACNKSKGTSANKFIKVYTTTYLCNYLNRANNRLLIKTNLNDTTSIFNLNKNTLKEMYENEKYFTVLSKNKKYLIDKDFNQITFNGYYNIGLTLNAPNFLIVEDKKEDGTIYAGVINLKEEKIIDYSYSGIKINAVDSFIIGCSSGISVGANDDVYNFEGKKISSYRRHIDIATKKFIVHKIFEPNEYYIVYTIETKEEKIINANEIKVFSPYELQYKLKNDWLIYNIATKETKPMPR